MNGHITKPIDPDKLYEILLDVCTVRLTPSSPYRGFFHRRSLFDLSLFPGARAVNDALLMRIFQGSLQVNRGASQRCVQAFLSVSAAVRMK